MFVNIDKRRPFVRKQYMYAGLWKLGLKPTMVRDS